MCAYTVRCLGQSNDSMHLSVEGLRNFEQNVSQKMPINSAVNVLWECVRTDYTLFVLLSIKTKLFENFFIILSCRICECFILEQHFIQDCV